MRQRALVLLSQILGRKFGVEIIFDPNMDTAATDGQKIYLPPLNDTGNEEDAQLIEGLIDHEAGGHCRFSDFTIRDGNPLVDALANVFEDIFIEREVAKVYPGSKQNLYGTASILVKRGVIAMPQGNETPPDVLVRVMMSGLRSRLLGQDTLQPIHDAFRPYLDMMLGSALAEKVWQVGIKADQITSTQGSYDLAREVMALLQQASQQPQPQPDEGKGGDGEEEKKPDGESSQGAGDDSQGSSGNNAGEGGAKDDFEGRKSPGKRKKGNAGEKSGRGQPSKAQGKEETKSEGGGDGKPESGKGNQPGDGAGETKPEITDEQRKAAEAMINAAQGDIGNSSLEAAISQTLSQSGAVSPVRMGSGAGHANRVTVNTGADNGEWYERQRLWAQPMVAKLGHRMDELIEATREEPTWNAQTGRKLDRNCVSRLASGDFRVYRKREEVEVIDTAVSFVVDFSGSMHAAYGAGDRMKSAWDTYFSLAEILARQDVPFSATAFAGTISSLKEFEESFRAVRRMPTGNTGATMTHEAVRFAGLRLLNRTEERKLMIVITDGIPSNAQAAAVEIDELRAFGVETAVVFINDDSDEANVTRFGEVLASGGSTFEIATNPAMLAQSVFKAVERAV